MTVRILNEDCLQALPRLAAEGVRAHSAVTDPPYHLTTGKRGGTGAASLNPNSPAGRSRISTGFMGKVWDGGDIAFQPETWAAVKDCLLPGAYLVAFGGTRGWHRMACAIEDAGFEIRDNLAWVTGSGFPKSLNIGLALPEWQGFGTALKPAFEPIVLARVPFKGTVVDNVINHGCGGLNIDAFRIEANGERVGSNGACGLAPEKGWNANSMSRSVTKVQRTDIGRWPANFLHDGSDQVEAEFASFVGDGRSSSRFFYTAKADSGDRAGSQHPTVKPTDLMRWLVQLVTPSGGTVLVPFAGTGSTGLAADQLGMNAVLIEQDATYAKDIHRKITGDAGMFARVTA